MLRPLLLLATCVLTSGAAIGADTLGNSEPCQVTILWGNPPISKLEVTTWVGYLMLRAQEHKGTRECGDTVQIVQPSFDEELRARDRAVTVYTAVKPKLQDVPVPYFEGLSRAFDAGFRQEYVWTYLYRPTWGAPPENFRLKEFDEWRAVNLNGHEGLTVGALGLIKAKPDYKGEIVFRPYDFTAAH